MLSFLCGLPRCGKSTYSYLWAKYPNRVVLSGDSFRLAVYGKRFQLVGEELVRASLITSARALLLEGYEVLIDDTNTSLTSVKQILAISQNVECYFFNVKAEECIKRAIACGQEDLIPSIKRMEENLRITSEFIFDNVKHTILNPGDLSYIPQ